MFRYVPEGDTAVVVHAMNRLAWDFDNFAADTSNLTGLNTRTRSAKENSGFTGEALPMVGLMFSTPVGSA